jgi:AhpD family alkylhydroperoxidase
MVAQKACLDHNEFRSSQADAYAALLALGKTVDDQGFDKRLTELVKLRVSQLNGCAFCLKLHLNIARKLGIADSKLDLVGVWREVAVFSEREKAALDWAEALTKLYEHQTLAASRSILLRHFSEQEVVLLTIAIGTINNWNRIAIALRFPPPIAAKDAA